MVPAFRRGVDEPQGQHQVGFMCSNIRNWLSPIWPDTVEFMNSELRKHCLINPIMLFTLEAQSCRIDIKPGVLRRRILEYRTTGSHKRHLIYDALSRGYERWVRVKIVEGSNPSRKNAEAMENALLKKYDYSCNIRINRQIRNIPPRCQKSINSWIVTLFF